MTHSGIASMDSEGGSKDDSRKPNAVVLIGLLIAFGPAGCGSPAIESWRALVSPGALSAPEQRTQANANQRLSGAVLEASGQVSRGALPAANSRGPSRALDGGLSSGKQPDA
jgi:hypothetical protein